MSEKEVKKSSKDYLTSKKFLIPVGIVELAIVIFCTVVSIMVLATADSNLSAPDLVMKNGAFIGTLQSNPTLFFSCFVIPLIVIFLIDGLYLIWLALTDKKEIAPVLSEDDKKAIMEQAKAEAIAELKKELSVKDDKKAK